MLYCLGVIVGKDKEPVGFMMMDMATGEAQSMKYTGAILGLASGGKILNIKTNDNWDKLVYKDGYKNMPKCFEGSMGNVYDSDGIHILFKETINGKTAYGVRRMFDGQVEWVTEQGLIARAVEVKRSNKLKGMNNPIDIVNSKVRNCFGNRSLVNVPNYVKKTAEWNMW